VRLTDGLLAVVSLGDLSALSFTAGLAGGRCSR
jgi:hypothetical protein